MGDLGFWALAQEDPDTWPSSPPTAPRSGPASCSGQANQVVHALRALGVQPGDMVATVLPNCAEMIEIYLAALQAGWYLVPINHHLVAPEIAYILQGLRRQGLHRPRALRRGLVAAADEAGIPAMRPLAVGDIDGFASYAATA